MGPELIEGAEAGRLRHLLAKLRGEVMDETGAELLDVAEFDLAIAHLHIPELV